MQVEHRPADDSVHHNRKIDTASFKQGKRRAPCECATALRDALTRYVEDIRLEIDTKRARRCKQPRVKTIAPGDACASTERATYL